MRQEQTRAIVLASRPLGEADRIVRLYTREHGRLDAVVKGVRKTSSKWGGRLEPFNICDVLFCRGRSNLHTLTQAQVVDVFPRLRDDREALTAAAVACEAVAGLTLYNEPEERIFNLLRNAFVAFSAGFEGPAMQAPLVLGVLLKLLYAAGYMPVLECCACCGGGGLAAGFSAAHGGLVCGDCCDDAAPLSPAAIVALQEAMTRPLGELRPAPASAAVAEALHHVHQLYGYHVGLRLRALHFAGAVGGAVGSGAPSA